MQGGADSQLGVTQLVQQRVALPTALLQLLLQGLDARAQQLELRFVLGISSNPGGKAKGDSQGNSYTLITPLLCLKLIGCRADFQAVSITNGLPVISTGTLRPIR